MKKLARNIETVTLNLIGLEKKINETFMGAKAIMKLAFKTGRDADDLSAVNTELVVAAEKSGDHLERLMLWHIADDIGGQADRLGALSDKMYRRADVMFEIHADLVRSINEFSQALKKLHE